MSFSTPKRHAWLTSFTPNLLWMRRFHIFLNWNQGFKKVGGWSPPSPHHLHPCISAHSAHEEYMHQSGISVHTKVESVSTQGQNGHQCPHQSGISVHTKVESVSTPKWNQCPHQSGISVHTKMEFLHPLYAECNVYTITKFKQYTIILTLISLHSSNCDHKGLVTSKLLAYFAVFSMTPLYKILPHSRTVWDNSFSLPSK